MKSITSIAQDTISVLNKLIFAILTLVNGLFLSACSTTNGVTAFAPTAAEADQATVYIYRPGEMANALYSPGVNINGEFKLYAKNNINSRLSLPPGKTLFEFQEEKKYAYLTPLSLDLQAGTIYFIRVSTSLKVKNTTSYEPYARGFKLSQVDEAQASKEIAECCINNSSSTKKADSSPDEKKSTDSFSVDKTQNPFSH